MVRCSRVVYRHQAGPGADIAALGSGSACGLAYRRPGGDETSSRLTPSDGITDALQMSSWLEHHRTLAEDTQSKAWSHSGSVNPMALETLQGRDDWNLY